MKFRQFLSFEIIVLGLLIVAIGSPLHSYDTINFASITLGTIVIITGIIMYYKARKDPA